MLNYKLSEKIIWETRQIIRPKSTKWNARLFSQMQTTNILGKISYYTPIHRNLCENEDEDTSTTNCIGIHEVKKKASSVLKRKKISGINFDGETINLTVKFSWEAFGDGNKGQPVQ